MKKLFNLKQFISLALALLMVISSTAWDGLRVEAEETRGENLIVNGTFDTDAEWTLEENAVSPNVAAGYLIFTTSSTNKQIVYQNVNVEPGKVYELTGSVNLSASGINKLSYQGYTEDGTPTTTTSGGYLMHSINAAYACADAFEYTDFETGESVETPTAGKWYNFTCEVTMDADTEILKLTLSGHTKKCYYDNISLCEVITEQEPTPSPSAEPEATPTPTAEPEPTPTVEPTTAPEVPSLDTGLIVDGGFEAFTGTTTDAWEVTGTVTAADAQKIGDSGYSLLLNKSGSSVSQIVEVEPGKTYELTGYVYANNKGIKLNLYGYQNAGRDGLTLKKEMNMGVAGVATSSGILFADLNGNPVENLAQYDWTQFSYVVTTTADTKFIEVKLERSGSAYVDNVSLKELAISLDPSSLALETDDEATLTATINNASDVVEPAITWESNNEEVATVENGKVTAIGKGEATITATATSHGNITASCTVTVTVPLADTGLIVDGGFEVFTGTDFDYWTELNAGSNLTPVTDPSIVDIYDGESVLKINGTARMISQMVDVEPGKTYELTGYVNMIKVELRLLLKGYQDADKATATATDTSMSIYADGQTSQSSDSLTIIDPENPDNPVTQLTPGTWYKFSRKVTVSADTEHLDVIIQGGSGGSGYFDNVSLFEVVPPEVTVDGVDYDGTLLEAIAAADTNSVIKLAKNIDNVETVTLDKGTLDLGGYTLEAGYFMAYDGTNVIDSSTNKTGLLKVAKEQFIFETENNNKENDNVQIPVYNGVDGYVFANVKHQEQRNSEVGADNFNLVFRPSLGTSEVVNNTLLASGGNAAGISIGIRLKWTESGEPMEKTLVYVDEMVEEVYSLGRAFYINAFGANKFENLTITPIVQSKLSESIVSSGTQFSAN